MGLIAETTAFQLSAGNSEKNVPSISESSGGGTDIQTQQEWVNFNVYLPLDPADRDLGARRFFDQLVSAQPAMFPESQRPQVLAKLLESAAGGPGLISELRTGRFLVRCRVLEGTRVVGVGVVELEVLFKGHFYDFAGPAGYGQAPPPDTKTAPASAPPN